MIIIPDPLTALVLTIPFLVTYAALHFILFKPLYAFMEEREQVIHAAAHETAELDGQIAQRMATLQQKLDLGREEATTVRTEARQKAHAAEAETLAAARQDAERRVTEAMRTIDAQRAQASAVLRETSTQLSQEIATTVLGREVQA